MGDQRNNILNLTQQVVFDGAREYEGANSTVTASASIESTFSVTFPEDVEGVLLYNSSANTVYIQFDGSAADANAFPIPTGGSYTAIGSKASLEDIRLYAASSSSLGAIVYSRR